MINKDLITMLELNEAQSKLMEHVNDIAMTEQVEITTMAELRDLLIYLEEKIADYPELNKMQLGMVENKVEAVISNADDVEKSPIQEPVETKKIETEKKNSDMSKAMSKTAKQVAKTTAGTVGRQVGKELGEKLGGAFGKTLGGNVGAELARSIVSNFGK